MNFEEQKDKLISFWMKNNLVNGKRLIDAFRTVPREKFVPAKLLNEAYDDEALPIGYGQTISQPTTIIIMLNALDVIYGHKVLEVGTGSGYQASLLSYLVGKTGSVITTELINELINETKERLKLYKNVKCVRADGSDGYLPGAPYDRIIVAAACPKIPDPLIKQLDNHGILVIPIGSMHSQTVYKVQKRGTKIEETKLGEFAFVPLRGRHGFK